ncbi:ER membrane protein complex subunit 1 isoform X2 [Arctopsyche grandis]|uniref:ER membrane protein complex subunit 1 isoform X2 n=1 Tax=Arctopsyche grandis TaxID=121162 RepID=UPI00406D8E8A
MSWCQSSGSRGAAALLRLVVALALVGLSFCLYEDQIGKFDWRQTYVGKIKFSNFDTISAAKKIIVATEENVLAALNLKSGQILWRHVLESGSQGNIQMLHVSDEVVTVSGVNPALIRGWDLTTGYLLWEWSLWLQGHAQQAAATSSYWWVENNLLQHLLPIPGEHLEMTSYNMRTGQNKGTTSKLPATWINNKCVLSAPYYTCISNANTENSQIISLDVTSSAVQLFTKSVSTILPNLNDNHVELRSLLGNVPGVILKNKIILLKPDGLHVTNTNLRDDTTGAYVVKLVDKNLLIQFNYKDENINVYASNIETGSPVSEFTSVIPLPGANYPKIDSAMCAKTAKNNLACRLFVTGDDNAVYLLQNPGKLVWVREEALSRIVGVEMLDLPVSELEAVIETEFDNKEGDIFGMITRRLKGQASQLKTLSNTLLRKFMPHLIEIYDSEESSNVLVRDEFGLHKIIIAVTDVGKVFAIDNLSGNIIWKRYIPFLSSFNGRTPDADNFVILYIQRTTRHLPYDPQCSIIARHKLTGEGIIFMFNPITGAALDLGVANLGYRIKQTLLLNQMNSESLKGLVIMDENEGIHVYPPSCSANIGNTYMFVADPNTAVVQGYVLRNEDEQIVVEKTWLIRLGGTPPMSHKITNVATKSSIEKVHSQGKVMGDRSVLYKYINPNLVAFTTEGPDPVHRDVIYLYLVDVVSGAIIMVQSHRKARGPIKIVHSENWVVYSYYSEKSRRPEIATVELYEGPKRSGGAFSSLQTARWPPEIARQAYVLPSPGPPLALATTITDRGITAKDILISLSTGAIVELPWVILDPRRPTVPMTNEMREEGLLQYTPEIPLPSEAVINYNQTVLGVKHMYTSPSGLESTCLVFAYGLDLFYTRVAPSKTFDLLKEDFDYSLIVIVLILLIVSSYAAKRFASRKVLRQAWK